MISVWDWIRTLISPLTWPLDHFRSRNNDNVWSQVELSSRNKAIRRKQENDALLTEKEREVTKLRTENIHLHTRCRSLDKLANERELKVVSLTEDYKQLQLINEDLKSQNSTYNRQVITLQRDGRQLQARNEDISRKLTENEERVDTLRQDGSQLQTRNEELSRQLRENEQQIDSLKKECGQLRTRNEDLQSQNSTYNRQVITLQRDGRQLQARNEDISRKLTENEERVDTLRQDGSQLRTRNEELSRQLRENEQQIDSLKKECGQLRTRNEDLQSQNSTYNRQVITLQRDGRQLQARNEDISRKLTENEERVDTLRQDGSQLRTRNEELSRQLRENEQQIDSLKKECGQLRTRLSEVVSLQVTDGNTNITSLRYQNRSDKLAEQFAEIYENHWTDCYQILTGHLKKTEEESIHILLQIMQTSYDLCLDRSQSNLTSATDLLFTVAGTSSGEHEKATNIFIQETLHKLKSYREKNFTPASSKIGKEIKAILMSTIRGPEAAACNIFVEECIRISWMMCIKDPPMYIFCDKEDVFDQNKYMPYTKAGPEVSYIVWPALYLHRNGPLMRKGVAQGESKKERPRNRKK